MRAKRIVAAILALVFFFYGWMQVHHRHDVEDYLNPGVSTSLAIVVGAHSHSSDADFPLFDNLRIVARFKPSKCLLCTFNRCFFLRQSVNEIDFTLQKERSNRIINELVFQGNVSAAYRLRAPPVLIQFS